MKYALTLLASAFAVSALARPQETVTETDAVETVTEEPTSVLESVMSEMTDAASEIESVLEAPTPAAELSPVQSCIDACDSDDVNCKAACVIVPSPNEDEANETTECAAGCDQGDGSAEATEAYSQCVQACIGQFFVSSETGEATAAPVPTETDTETEVVETDVETEVVETDVETEVVETDTETMVAETETETDVATETDTDVATETDTETETETDESAEPTESGVAGSASSAAASATSSVASAARSATSSVAQATGTNAASPLAIGTPLTGFVGVLLAALSL